MRTNFKKLGTFIALSALSLGAVAQGIQPDMQYYRLPGYDGLNVFETGKKNEVQFDGFKVRLGGDFALQFQALDHESGLAAGGNLGSTSTTNAWTKQKTTTYNRYEALTFLAPSVNLPTANLNLDVQLADGLRIHLRTYLSARHHNESWVKGGYIMIDRLDFIKKDFASGLMDIMSVKMGVDNLSYGDAVYRRSDNAMAIYNPFVGNYLMDNNTVEPFMELQFFPGDFIAIGGVGTAILNPTVIRKPDPTDPTQGVKTPPAFWAKLGWDKKVNEDLRIRLTGSIYNSSGFNNGGFMYAGDRAGGRYYKVLDYTQTQYTANNAGDTTNMVNGVAVTNDFSGRVNPGFKDVTNFQINPFVKFKGIEFFGIYEVSAGRPSETLTGKDNVKFTPENGNYTQIGAELIYRFGGWEQFYVAARYNVVNGQDAQVLNSARTELVTPDAKSVSRMNFGGGWFMTKNVLVKLEYVSQVYDDKWAGTLMDAKFNGVMLEAVVCF